MSLTRKNQDLVRTNDTHFESYPIFKVEFYPKIRDQNKGF